MNAREFNIAQIETQNRLIRDHRRKIRSGLQDTQQEKDLYNLRILRAGIRHGSMDFRSGCIGTLNRAIERLEREMAENGD